MPFDPDKYLAEKSAPQAASPSGFDPDKYLAEKHGVPVEDDRGTTEKAVMGAVGAVAPYIAPIGRAVDRFTGAPVRSAIGAVQNGENPVQAYMNQFGANPEQAPTGKEIAQKAGLGNTSLSDVAPSLYDKSGKGWALRKGGMLDPTASGAAGMAIDVVADPLNVVGAGEIANLAKGAGKIGLKTAGKGVELGAKALDATTGIKAATGTIDAAKSAATTAENVAKAARQSIDNMLKPSLAKDAGAMEAIAKKHGIPSDLMSPAHEFGDASSITRLQKNIAEGALGQKYLEAHNNGILKTSEALEKNISSKFGNAPSSAADAGQVLKDAVDEHISKVFQDADITYKSASKQFPGIKIDEGAWSALQSKAEGMSREAKRLARTSADPTQLSQAQNLEKWADLIQNSKGSYKEMSEIVQNVGKAAYAKTPIGQIPADVKKLRELYDVGSEALIQSIRNKSASAADRLIVNNAEIREMLGDQSMLGKVVKEAKNPEQVFNSLVKNGGSQQVETLRKILPEQTFNQLRAKYLQDLVKYQADGLSINFGTTRKALEKNSERLSYLFKPEELKDATELLKFGERYGSPVLSQSGTGASSGFKGFAKNLLHAGQDEHALEYMKSKARGAAGTAQTPPSASPPVSGRDIFRNRGPMELRLKAAQSVSPSTYARPAMIKPLGEEKNDTPAKGPDKWASDGLKKLQEHSGESLKGIDIKDPKIKDLLIQASDLKPGSKAMKEIMERIKRGPASSKP